MDAALRRLEQRVAEDPRDLEARAELAQAYLRSGDPQRALRAARGGPLHEEAAAALGAAHGLRLLGLEPSESWGPSRDETRARERLILIPAGSFLCEGAQAWASSLRPGGSRAPLRPERLEDYLISALPTPARSWEDAARQAAAQGGALPSFREWKKSWRGGLVLDGEPWGSLENPDPDRLRPAGLSAGTGLERSPYGVMFPLGNQSREWCGDSREWACALADDGRYRVAPGRLPLLVRWVIRLRPT